MKTAFALLFSICSAFYAYTANCTSIASGDWNNPATWSCGVAPSPSDNVTVDAAHTVTVSSNTNLNGVPMVITINGILLFDSPGAKLRLECGSSVIVNAGGSIQDSGVGTPSHSITLCGVDVWSGSSGTLLGPVILGAIPLPVELISFSVVETARTLSVKWTTASEHNSDRFQILASADGEDWIVIGVASAAGNSSEIINYEQSIVTSENLEYFQLEQIDLNGERFTSPIITKQKIRSEQIKIYPNPSNGSLITIDAPEEDTYNVTIVDQSGSIAYNESFPALSRITLNDTNLEQGIYILQVYGSHGNYTSRLIIE